MRFPSPGWGIMTKKGLYNSLIEATFCQDKQALGLVKRRQHTWEAQQVVLLLARLAHHILLWSKHWLSRVPTTRGRLDGYGLVRLLQEGTTVPGVIQWRCGWMVSVHFDPLHPLAEALQQGFAALSGGVSGWVFCAKNWQLVESVTEASIIGVLILFGSHLCLKVF